MEKKIKGHEGEKKIQFWLDEKLIIQFDEALTNLGYKNRHDWWRETVKNIIKEGTKK
ncbi:MAG: hypothetical protein N2647_05505 [Thermodesulfovibrio sp.]|nr:hypothetical protein [Thermodesulfovibrio sp.]